MLARAALLIVGAYLVGSIPLSYLAGRWLKGIDLRQYGSGTASGSMVYEHVARWAVVPVGLAELGKVALPAWLALRWGPGLPIATAAGLAATVGHCWPLFLHFQGGRGLGSFLGLLLVIFPWGFPWLLLFLAVGWLRGDSAPWALGGLITLPAFGRLLGAPAVLTPAAGAMLLLTLLKRLEANRRPLPPPGTARRIVLVRRLLFDRDIRSHADWLRREPVAQSDPRASERRP